MADIALEKVSRGFKVLYEELFNNLIGGKKGIDEFLYPSVDNDLSANFAYDDLIYTPHAIAFRKSGGQAEILPYAPGVGRVYPIPIASAATPIDERLRDAVIAGGEATESFASNNGRLMNQILKQHVVSWNVTKWKLALEQLRTSVFMPLGLGGKDIGLSIDQGRDGTLATTYNFTNTGATMDIALKQMYNAGRAQHLPNGNLIVLMGKKWQAQFENDTTIQGKREANTSNDLLQQQMNPTELGNVFGLYRLGMYRVPGVSTPFTLCSYEVDTAFYQYEGATAEDFLDENEAILFSTNSTRWTINRGIDILNDAQQAIRVVGDIVYDDFTEKNPVQYNIRSSMRKAYLQADPNTVVRCRGTFGSDSE